jgi:hypothetical protein
MTVFGERAAMKNSPGAVTRHRGRWVGLECQSKIRGGNTCWFWGWSVKSFFFLNNISSLESPKIIQLCAGALRSSLFLQPQMRQESDWVLG